MVQISLAAARVNANMTQKEAAERIGVTPQTIFNWEKGCSEPSIQQAIKLSEVYGIPIDQIFFGMKSN